MSPKKKKSAKIMKPDSESEEDPPSDKEEKLEHMAERKLSFGMKRPALKVVKVAKKSRPKQAFGITDDDEEED
jgi:hypothetical protein